MIAMGVAQKNTVDLWADTEQTRYVFDNATLDQILRSGLRLLEALSSIISDKGMPTSRIRRDLAVAISTQLPPISLLPR